MPRICFLVLAFVVFDTWTVSEVLAASKHRCYVCVPNTGSSISDVLQMFPKSPPVPLCSNFQLSDPKYIRECPSSSDQGCLTQTNGTHVTKTCTEVGLEDCKTANRIKYCYCKGDLCNKETVPTEAPVPPKTEDEDDEDFTSEGSGFDRSYEESESQQVETSSKTDPGIHLISSHLPTTTKSVILMTSRPDYAGNGNAATQHSAQLLYVLYFMSFLLICYRL